MSALWVNAAGALLIGLILWWFWLARPAARPARGDAPIEVVVDQGVYTPARIEVPAGRTVRLRFLRKDPSPSAGEVIFPDLGVSASLPVGRPAELSLHPPAPGEYVFTCQMQMYRGILVAR